MAQAQLSLGRRDVGEVWSWGSGWRSGYLGEIMDTGAVLYEATRDALDVRITRCSLTRERVPPSTVPTNPVLPAWSHPYAEVLIPGLLF